ncbi:hypothetical protein CEE44_00850 [Candidatus Woesearchaeota archaeon B3_Woes]|nr:MAG: hypothetical protein CEE44_00850 [Candidatus Woesearchaeota archaeon B3_Woes]
MKIKIFFIFFIFFLLLNFVSSAEPPKLPMIISGEVLINEKPAKVGTIITAKIDEQKITSVEVSKKGHYTLLIQEPTEKLINLYVNEINTDKTVKYGVGKIEQIDLLITQETPNKNKLFFIIPIILLILIIFILLWGKKKKK